MTMKLPQKAGFVPTTAEWDQLVRIAENLAAQLAQAQASAVETARIVGAERDAARAEVARLTAAAERLLKMHTRPDGSIGSDTSMVEGALMDLRAALRQSAPEKAWCTCGHTNAMHDTHGYCGECACDTYQPAPAQQISTSDGVTWHTFGGNTPPEQVAQPAPAQGQRQDASDNEIFGPAFAPRKTGGEARK